MSPRRGKILVIRGGAIGDFILTLPAIAALRERFPGVHLELLGYPHIAQLAYAGELVDAVRPIESQALAGFFAQGGTLAEDLRDYFSEFDVILSYLYDPDGVFQENVARCTCAQFIAGPHRARDEEDQHAASIYLKPLERLAIFGADQTPRLTLRGKSAPRLDAADAITATPTVALHPGSGSERKNWAEGNWRELIRDLAGRTEFRILLVGGEAEGDRLTRLSAMLPQGRHALARNLPLVELAGLLQSCTGFVGHDSGITHLAASLGVPCLVLWGDTAEGVWRPGGDRVRILRETHGLGALSVPRVSEALRQMLAA